VKQNFIQRFSNFNFSKKKKKKREMKKKKKKKEKKKKRKEKKKKKKRKKRRKNLICYHTPLHEPNNSIYLLTLFSHREIRDMILIIKKISLHIIRINITNQDSFLCSDLLTVRININDFD